MTSVLAFKAEAAVCNEVKHRNAKCHLSTPTDGNGQLQWSVSGQCSPDARWTCQFLTPDTAAMSAFSLISLWPCRRRDNMTYDRRRLAADERFLRAYFSQYHGLQWAASVSYRV